MILPDDYFKTYAENLSTTGNPKEAWWETEQEFNRRYSCTAPGVVVRRFKTYRSFQASYRQYKKGGLPGHIEIVFLWTPTATK